ncbi:DNA-binding protein [Paenibacillus ihbetae]|uniref:DNA-binding protein n=1 Tax=Paenibacillus ihbetae TaxID=1870820 RepID=A0A1B2DVG5_9BACL|nr:helix-turn-helix transcriptional regulator [Paenibacillus ihbetae]ANY71694.1 DNA-binding protein [Paenibacillus ihbetae]
MYKNLRAEMTRNDVTIGDMAKVLGVRYATVNDKLNGKFRFYYDEASKIKRHFFPNCDLEYLFDSTNQNTA